ncbi:MAG: sigma-70 family RNA polymerase sigma factor [Pseudomonadota bacterium]
MANRSQPAGASPQDAIGAQTPNPEVAPPSEAPDDITALYGAYAPTLSASLRKMFGDGPPDPEDVAQQAFAQVIERGNLRSIANLKAFVWRTARNIVLAAKRSDTVRSRYDYEVEQIYFPLKGDVSTPESIIEAKEQLKAVNALMLQMPEKRRRALMLHRVEGLSIAEVGRRLGISRSTAAQHIARAAADLDLMLLNTEDR